MVGAGIRRVTRGHVAVEKAIEDAGANEALKLRRNLRVLYAIGSVATLLGLIGTISGMIKAFRVASGGGLGKSELLAKGIYEAMVCTFGGLAVAILVTIFYYWFVGRIERLIGDLNDEVIEFAADYIDDLPAATDDALETAAARSGPNATSESGGPLPEFSLAR
jgi:biopolymer transport protein ExbB